MLTIDALNWLKQEWPKLFENKDYGTLDIEKEYQIGYYIWPKVYCLIDTIHQSTKSRIKGVSNNSMVVDEQLVLKYKKVNLNNKICSRPYTIEETREIYKIYNEMNNKVKDNYQHIFERLINKEKVWLLQNTF